MFALGWYEKDQTDASFPHGPVQLHSQTKNAWELGVHAGHFFIDGDVDRTIPGGYGLGLHLRGNSLLFSIRADLFYGSATGLEPQPWTHATVGEPVGGGLIEKNIYPMQIIPMVGSLHTKTTQAYGVLQVFLTSVTSFFHQKNNKWNWYWTLGVGLSSHSTKLDLLDANNQPYQNLLTVTGWSPEKFDTKKGRGEIKDALKNFYDGTYETAGPKKAGIFRLGDETNIHVMFTTSVGVSKKIEQRINLGIEHQVMATDNDYLDGIRFRSEDDLTADVDLEHYTNLRLAINLGNLDKVTEPLYWVNPLDATMNDIAELKARPVLDLTDSDSDGVIDMLDQE